MVNTWKTTQIQTQSTKKSTFHVSSRQKAVIYKVFPIMYKNKVRGQGAGQMLSNALLLTLPLVTAGATVFANDTVQRAHAIVTRAAVVGRNTRLHKHS